MRGAGDAAVGRGVAGRADGGGAAQAGDDGAVGGGAVGLPAVGCGAFLDCGDGSEVCCRGFGEELLESVGRQGGFEFGKQKDPGTLS